MSVAQPSTGLVGRDRYEGSRDFSVGENSGDLVGSWRVHAPSPIEGRSAPRLAVSVALAALSILARSIEWVRSAELHTVMETAATLLALLVGVWRSRS